MLKPNKLLVVDIDYPDKVDFSVLPETFTVKTGGGGYHLYYWNIEELPSNHKPEWGEIKTTGHVVGHGVTHESGKTYEIAEHVPIVTIEREELEEILKDSRPDKSGNPAGGLHPNHADISDCQELYFIKSDRKRRKVLKILRDSDPDHNDRLWLAGFLNYIGLNQSGIINVITQFNHWSDYDKGTTRNQVKSVLKGKKGGDTFE